MCGYRCQSPHYVVSIKCTWFHIFLAWKHLEITDYIAMKLAESPICGIIAWFLYKGQLLLSNNVKSCPENPFPVLFLILFAVGLKPLYPPSTAVSWGMSLAWKLWDSPGYPAVLEAGEGMITEWSWPSQFKHSGPAHVWKKTELSGEKWAKYCCCFPDAVAHCTEVVFQQVLPALLVWPLWDKFQNTGLYKNDGCRHCDITDWFVNSCFWSLEIFELRHHERSGADFENLLITRSVHLKAWTMYCYPSGGHNLQSKHHVACKKDLKLAIKTTSSSGKCLLRAWNEESQSCFPIEFYVKPSLWEHCTCSSYECILWTLKLNVLQSTKWYYTLIYWCIH